jgi:hypothetical protein
MAKPDCNFDDVGSDLGALFIMCGACEYDWAKYKWSA